MRAVLPSCILFKIATALFSHTFRSHSSTALWASSPVCAGAVRIVGVPSALRKGLSSICGAGKEVTAEATRRRSLSRISFDRDVFCVMSASALIHIWLKGEACFRFHVPFVPDCFVRPLGCFAVDFGQIPFHIVFAKKII